MTAAVLNRPGITDAFLAGAGCHHVGADECVKRYGFRAEGIAIPFHDANGSPIMDSDRPFTRVRLYHATDDQKYHQRPGSGVHVYIPPTFAKSSKGSRLILVEGEFKALALAEAGYTALGLCGFNGAARTTTGANRERDHALNDELVDLLKIHQPAEVVFLGDADVVWNAHFAVEAAKLRRILFASKQFHFLERFTVAKLPFAGPKGADDLRAQKGEGFNECFDSILSNGYEVPAKASATEIFVALLNREKKSVKRLVAKQDHEASRARVRLLQSAGQIWNETGARLELKPLIADLLNLKPSEVAGLVKDAAAKKQESESGKEQGDNAQGSAVEFPDIEPWERAVNGAEVLNEIAAAFSRYLALPPGAADALALWTPHAHAFEAFVHTPRLNLYSPDKGCGKTLLLDVLAVLVPRSLRTESITAAVLFRLVELHKPTLLLDEVDTYLGEAEELRGLLNAGHKRGAKAYRCEGENNTVRGFSAFAPAVLAGIGSLPGTLHDRSIVVKLVRAKPGEVTARFDSRRTDKETELCRKLARWTADNFEKLKTCDPRLPEIAFNRLADNWRPLFAVAEIAGGDWPQRAAEAFTKLTSADDLDAQGIGATLLADIAAVFAAAKVDKLPSVKLAEMLGAIEGRPWAEFGKARNLISANQLANQLRRFGVAPHTIRVGNETPKGYALADFTEAFERFLPNSAVTARHTATTLEQIGDSPLSRPQQDQPRGVSENATSTNDDAACGVVAFQKTGKAEVEEGAMLL